MKPKLYVLHGALGSCESLQGVAHLLEPNFEVYLHTFPGHGHVAPIPNWTLGKLAEHLLETLPESAFVFAYSMGGYVALLAETLKPGYLNALFCLGTKFDWSAESSAREIKKLDCAFLQAKAPEYVAQLKVLQGEDRWEALLHETGQMMQDLSERETLHRAAFTGLKCPVTICLAENDRMVSRTESLEMLNVLPKAEFVGIEGGHSLDSIDQNVLANLIKERFLG